MSAVIVAGLSAPTGGVFADALVVYAPPIVTLPAVATGPKLRPVMVAYAP